MASRRYFIAKKFFTRLRDEDDSIVLDRRLASTSATMMLETRSQDLFHHRSLQGLSRRCSCAWSASTEAMLKKMLERRWRAIAPKKLLKEIDDARPVIPGETTAKRREGRATPSVERPNASSTS